MEQLVQDCFSWPALPSTTLLLCVVLYWIMMLLGAVDLDFMDVDIDLDLDVDVNADISVLQMGFVPVKWLNIGSVPTMLWVSVFSLTGWMVGQLWRSPLPHSTFDWSIDLPAIFRDYGVAALMTKGITQPLRGRFDPVEPNKSEDLVGQVCLVTTSEVSETFGEGKLATEGAPLRLKIRSDGSDLRKGDTALIVDFQTEGNLYFVTRYEEG